ncbi:Fe-S cluster assembly protein SufD [Pseudomonadota bacterium]
MNPSSPEADNLNAYVVLHAENRTLFDQQNSGWLDNLRAASLDHFQNLGFPSTRNEDWKYTDLRGMLRHRFSLASLPVADDAIEHLLNNLPDAHRLVFIDGEFAPTHSSVDHLESGLELINIAVKLEADPDSIKQHLGSCADIDQKAFAALNTAFIKDGAFVRINKGCLVEKPIDLVFIASGADQAQLVSPRVSIVAEEDSKASVREHYLSLSDGKYFSNAVTEIELLPGAELDHCKLQMEGKGAYHIGGLFSKQRKGSQLISHAIMLGGRLARNEIYAALTEENAQCELNGLFIAKGRQHIDNYTHIHHATHNCTSRELYKGVIDDHAHGVFHGRVVVDEHAQKTDANQQNNNLLLSGNAEIDTKPQLEIYADDVKCAHGATVGQLDENALFFLRSRGIALAEARAILTGAFLRDAVAKINDEQLRSYVDSIVLRQLDYIESSGKA